MGLFDFLKPRQIRTIKPPLPSSPPLPPRSEPSITGEEAIHDLAERLRSHLLPTCYGIVGDNVAQTAVTSTSFGGDPYAEQGDQWPMDKETGQPMRFLFQVNSADLPVKGILPDGMIVVFACDGHMENCDLRESEWPLALRYYAQSGAARYARLDRPTSKGNADAPAARNLTFVTGQSLPDEETALADEYADRYGRIGILMRSMKLGTPHFAQARSVLVGEPPRRPLLQIGGHPQWVQYAEPPDEGQLPHERFLMQINSSYKLGVAWDDEGAIYVYGLEGSRLPDYAVFQCG